MLGKKDGAIRLQGLYIPPIRLFTAVSEHARKIFFFTPVSHFQNPKRKCTMAPRLLNRPFTFLFSLLMGILLSLDIIGTYGFYAIQQDLLTNSGESLALAASDIAGKIDRLALEQVKDIDFVAQSLDLLSPRADNITDILQRLKNTHPSFLFFCIARLSWKSDGFHLSIQNWPCVDPPARIQGHPEWTIPS